MDAAAIPIRAVREADAASYNACLGRIARTRLFIGLTDEPALEQTAAYVKDMVERNLPFYVAIEPDETVIGWCDIIVAKPRPERPGFDHVGVFGICVDEPYRGRGLGGRLATVALAHADRAGIERVELQVFAGNAVGIALYRKLGFVLEGVRRRARKIDGRYEDVVAMARLSGPAAA